MGLMKADGKITQSEMNKVRMLVMKFKHSMPGDEGTIISMIEAIETDADYKDWDHWKHLELGLECWDKFHALGLSEDEYLESILTICEILMELDEIHGEEEKYVQRITEECKNRYQKS
jgi:hypothetical protein